MALELPTYAYLTAFAKQAFPNRVWNPGSGISDLILKPAAIFQQPFRHELDVVKVGQSVLNYAYMRPSDLNALAANWGIFRQTGSLSVGTVTIYFSVAAQYQLNYLEFYAKDGTIFILQAPVTITIAQLLANQQSDGTFAFGVAVQSVGIGDRYALPAGSIIGVNNPPAGIARVTNLTDFSVTSPNQDNFDVVNSMFKNLGLRNLVSPSSIRAPILDTFPGVTDIYVAGATDKQMVRDLITVEIESTNRTIHLGGLVDVWLNTTALLSGTVTIGYVPSSLLIKLITAAMAQNDTLIYAFTEEYLTVDGQYAAPDNLLTVLDESDAISFDIAGLPVTVPVLGPPTQQRYQLAVKDILSGDSLLVIPCPGDNIHNPSLWLADLSGIVFANTAMDVGDYINFDGQFRKITSLSGNVIEASPSTETSGPGLLSYQLSAGVTNPGDRFVPIAGAPAIAQINDRATILLGPANGDYKVLKVNSSGIWLGVPIADGELIFFATDGAGNSVFSWINTATGSTPALLPLTANETCSIYTNTDGAYDQTSSLWFPILAIKRTLAATYITLPAAAGTGTINPASVVQGLRAALEDATEIYITRSSPAHFTSNRRQPYDVGNSHYSSTLEVALPAASTQVEAPGLGFIANVGDLLLFEGGFIPGNLIPATGGDGSKLTLVVTAIIDYDTVAIAPSLTYAIPAGTPFSLMTNELSISGPMTVTATNPGANRLTFASWPFGLGDGLGMVVQYIHSGTTFEYIIVASSAGSTRVLPFVPPQTAIDLTMSGTGYVPLNPNAIGQTVTQIVGPTTYTGTLYAYSNATRIWTIIPATPSDVFATGNFVTVNGAPSTGNVTAISSTYSVGYYTPLIGDIGSIVRQGTYVGVLAAFDNTAYTWTITPMSPSDLFDRTDTPTFVDYGTGQPQTSPNQGWGTARGPATVPIINSGPATITLDRPFDSSLVPTSTINIHSRLPKSGGFFNVGNEFRVLPDSSVSTSTPFSAVVLHDEVIVPQGANAGLYGVTAPATTSPYFISTDGAPTPEIVRIANAPVSQVLPITGTISSGTTALTFTGSGLGEWAHEGRIFVLTVGGVTYYLLIAAGTAADSFTLTDPLPVTLSPTSGATGYIVEGFFTPYYVALPASLFDYRVIAPPAIGEVYAFNNQGSYTSEIGFSNLFTDSTQAFDSLFAGMDFSRGELLLYLDSGPDASTTPIVITGVSSSQTLLLGSFNFTDTQTAISYHIVRRNINNNTEVWVTGVITDATHITLDPDTSATGIPYAGWDYTRNGHKTYETSLAVSSLPTFGGTPFDFTMLPGSDYNATSRVITVDMAVNHVVAVASLITPGTGFVGAAIGAPVRVMARLVDRVDMHNTPGSALATFNYYASGFFTLPIVKILSVQALDPATLQPTRALPYTLVVNNQGLRYSNEEDISLQIDDGTVVGQPVQIQFLADSSIAAVNEYLSSPDTMIVNANQLAKRMETVSVDVTVNVRSTNTAAQVATAIATYINSVLSTQTLSVDQIIKYLYTQGIVSFVDLSTMEMDVTYYQFNGTVVVQDAVTAFYGAPTACYLAGNINVTVLGS
jgi:hypothetical protein